MKIIRKRRLNRFTLVELLVAMAVFSILMLLMVQFFSASQRIWVNMEQKNNLYADARVAMDLITTLVQGTYYIQGQSISENAPYQIVMKDTDTTGRNDTKNEDNNKFIDEYNSKIYFPTQSQIDLIEDAGKVMFVSIQRATGKKDTSGQLRMAVLTDKDKDDSDESYDFSLLFPPYVDKLYSWAKDKVIKNLNDSINNDKTAEGGEKATDGKICVTLLDNVTAFRLIPTFLNNSSTSVTFNIQTNGTPVSSIPFMIEIRLTMMSTKDYDFWWNELKVSSGKESDQAKNYRIKHEHTFSRTVYLGDRRNYTF